MILSGRKINAIATLRKELGISLAEAKAIVDQFQADSGTMLDEAVDSEGQLPDLIPCYKMPWMLHIIISLGKSGARTVPKALRLAEQVSMPVNYHYLMAHSLTEQSPLTLVQAYEKAKNAGLDPDVGMLSAAAISLGNEENLMNWINDGMPSLSEYEKRLGLQPLADS